MKELLEIKKGKVGYGLLIENDFGFVGSNDNTSNLNEAVTPIGESEVYFKNGIKEPIIFPVVFQKFGIENANGRIYPEEVLKREVEKYMDEILNGSSTGEANHPDSCILDIDRLSHLVTDLHWEKHTLLGNIKLLVSPGFIKYGVISCVSDNICNLMRHGVKLGVSSRGVGSVESIMGKTIVQDDFELICFDIVTQPSTPNAWIGKSEKELKQYTESKTSELSNKLNKFIL